MISKHAQSNSEFGPFDVNKRSPRVNSNLFTAQFNPSLMRSGEELNMRPLFSKTISGLYKFWKELRIEYGD